MVAAYGSDFLIVCGFLGSGKTTLISDFLKDSDASDTAVIVNDVGAINVDGAVLAEAGDLILARLANGCVCCSLGNELLATIEGLIADRQLQELPAFRRFVLECSGISDPGPIVRSLSALGDARFRIKIVCTFSCTANEDLADDFREAAAQMAAANVIVLTKTDLVDADRAKQTAYRALQLAPLGELLHVVDRGERARAAFTLDDMPAVADNTSPSMSPLYPKSGRAGLGLFSGAKPHPRIAVYQLTYDQQLDWSTLQDWLENVVGYFDERLLRLKGIVRVTQSEFPILVQSVGTHVAQPRTVRSIEKLSSLFLVIRDGAVEELDKMEPHIPMAKIERISAIAG